MKAQIKWVDDMLFVAESGSGHAIVIDGPPELGGRNLGARPMELLLLGLGGCTAVDVIQILKKARQAVSDCVVHIEAERAETEPRVFTRIRVHFVVTGRQLSEHHVQRAVSLSAEKYCSASIMLGKTAAITHTWTMHESQPA
jgi:putative redox protein